MSFYRAVVKRVLDSTHAEVRIDLGFRIYQPAVATYPEGVRWCFPGAVRYVYITADGDRGWAVRLEDPRRYFTVSPLWQYEASLLRVIDGDTFDARVRFPTGLELEERFRLSGVQAAELGEPVEFGEYCGVDAKRFIEERFGKNNGEMEMKTSHRGKWRRWLALVFLRDCEVSLNIEMVEVGAARRYSSRGSRTNAPYRRVDVRLSRPLYDSLSHRASLLKLKPNTLAHNVVRDYLEQPPADEPR